MYALSISSASNGHDGIVRCPLPSDGIGSALRGVYGEVPALPAEMLRLLQRLDRRN